MLRAFIDRIFQPGPTIDAETFILWEPCSKSHGEIIPGYASYLLALGYKVLVLMTPARISEGLFSRFSHPRLTLATLSQRRIRLLMRDPVIATAAGVMISTVGKLANSPDGRVNLDDVFGEQRPRRLVLVDHDVGERVAAGVWDPNTVTLRAIENTPSVVVNPHDFGAVAKRPTGDGRVKFIMVGAARAKRRNLDLVHDACSRLLAIGETRFELRMIGKRGNDPIPDHLRPFITEVGPVDFRQLYAEMEAANFVVTSFQRDYADHVPYRTTKTSGSFQLCYGFSTPCIVQRDFAAYTALNAKNSLLYDRDDEMFDAFHKAITMQPDDYAAMERAMRASAQTLYDRSLSNLKALTDAPDSDSTLLRSPNFNGRRSHDPVYAGQRG
jgi:hypothetical protein